MASRAPTSAEHSGDGSRALSLSGQLPADGYRAGRRVTLAGGRPRWRPDHGPAGATEGWPRGRPREPPCRRRMSERQVSLAKRANRPTGRIIPRTCDPVTIDDPGGPGPASLHYLARAGPAHAARRGRDRVPWPGRRNGLGEQAGRAHHENWFPSDEVDLILVVQGSLKFQLETTTQADRALRVGEVLVLPPGNSAVPANGREPPVRPPYLSPPCRPVLVGRAQDNRDGPLETPPGVWAPDLKRAGRPDRHGHRPARPRPPQLITPHRKATARTADTVSRTTRGSQSRRRA